MKYRRAFSLEALRRESLYSETQLQSSQDSQGIRSMIARRSPQAFLKVGLLTAAPEKAGEPIADATNNPFCTIRFGYKESRNMFRVFQRKGQWTFSAVKTGGEGGIRTLGTGVSPYNGLANRRIRPLCHLSGAAELQFITVVHTGDRKVGATFSQLAGACQCRKGSDGRLPVG